jgi:hypothetical protein
MAYAGPLGCNIEALGFDDAIIVTTSLQTPILCNCLNIIRSCENQILCQFRIFFRQNRLFAQKYDVHSSYLLEKVRNTCT